nr:MAG TPA_asm: hypothetical protein [Caudoviricetes sp.]DAQ50439.1 MAG TPA: hypothetical protein [Caudoviricetes sp.]
MPRAERQQQINNSQPTGTVGHLRSEDSFLWPIFMGSSVWILTSISDRRRIYNGKFTDKK